MKKVGRKVSIIKLLVGILGCVCIAAIVAGIITYAGNLKKKQLIEERGSVNIVAFGDSIWAISKDETGIAAILEEELEQARVTDCSIMGTRASYKILDENAPQEELDWNKISLMGILTEPEGMELLMEKNGLSKIPLEDADYIVIAYGLNDYFAAIPRTSENPYDPYTYAGALRTAVSWFAEHYPQAKVVLHSQTYCQGYSYGKVDSESDYKDYGGGTGPDYVAVIEQVAEEMDCIFVNNYEDMGINIHNGPKYLSDATHLTEYGRSKYAKNLAKYLLEDYEVKE